MWHAINDLATGASIMRGWQRIVKDANGFQVGFTAFLSAVILGPSVGQTDLNPLVLVKLPLRRLVPVVNWI
jgi:hypothetical protein